MNIQSDPSYNPDPASILIVDDEPANLAVLSDVLQQRYRVRAARSGEQALRIAASQPQPELLLLDIMMPGMDGRQVLERLRANPETRHIPVIFVTALDTKENELQGLAQGAADYITKPIKPAILLARVKVQLELKQARDELQRQNLDLEAEVRRRQKENEQIQLQLLQADKMAAIGQLAAGVAHEINTPVGFVRANLDSLGAYLQQLIQVLEAYRALDSSALDLVPEISAVRELERQADLEYLIPDIRQLILESRDGMNRVRDIVRDLKGFSRQSESQWEWADLHQGLDSTINIVWNQLKYHCELHKEYGRIPQIYCLPSQLNQVFMNLLVNAAQAIRQQGAIHLRTGSGAARVWVEVADSGTGIAPEHLKHLFEPFFTTKPMGEGTGLGLSLSYGIVQRHGGNIEVQSEAGQGTRFRVVLPVRPPERENGGGERGQAKDPS